MTALVIGILLLAGGVLFLHLASNQEPYPTGWQWQWVPFWCIPIGFIFIVCGITTIIVRHLPP